MLKHTIKFALVAFLAAAAGLAWAQSQAQAYKLTLLPMPGGMSISANAINERGLVVGIAWDASGVQQAVMWKRGVPTVLTGLDSDSAAIAINGRGQAVGYSFDSNSGMQAVRWDGTTPTVLERPEGFGFQQAIGISRSGEVAGNVAPFWYPPTQAVRWTRSKPKLLDNLGGSASVANGINDSGDVVGYIVSPNGSGRYEPTVWHGTVATVLGSFLPEATCCDQAFAINDSGQVVGWLSSTLKGDVRAVVWNGTMPIALQALSGADRALAVNNKQQAVGLLNAGGVPRGALWNLSSGEGVDINSFLTPEQKNAGWVLGGASGINDRGVITGAAYNSKTATYSAYQLAPL